jgi:hypothetical protein
MTRTHKETEMETHIMMQVEEQELRNDAEEPAIADRARAAAEAVVGGSGPELRAAPAMVRGDAAYAGGAGIGLNRHYDVVDNMKGMADGLSTDDAVADRADIGQLKEVTAISDIRASQAVIARIDAAASKLQDGGHVAQFLKNVSTKNELQRLLSFQAEDSTGKSFFQDQYTACMADYSRIEGSVLGLIGGNPKMSNLVGFEGRAMQLGKSGADDFVGGLKKEMGIDPAKAKEVAGDRAGDMLAARNHFVAMQQALQTSAKGVNDAQNGTTTGMAHLSAAMNALEAKPGRPKNSEDGAQVQRVVGQFAAMKGLISNVCSAVAAFVAMPAMSDISAINGLVSAVQTGTSAVEEGAGKKLKALLDKGVDQGKDAALDLLVDMLGGKALETARMADGLREKVEQFAWDGSFADNVREAQLNLKQCLANYRRAMADVKNKKQTLREAAEQMGSVADARQGGGPGGGSRFTAMALILGDVETFLKQCEVVKQASENEKSMDGSVRDQRQKVVGPETMTPRGMNTHPEQALWFYEVNPRPHMWRGEPLDPVNGVQVQLPDKVLEYAKQRLANGELGTTKDKLVEDLQAKIDTMAAVDAQLRSIFGASSAA